MDLALNNQLYHIYICIYTLRKNNETGHIEL